MAAALITGASIPRREAEQAARNRKALNQPRRCRVCSCAEEHPCNPVCAFTGKEDVCNRCAIGVAAYLEWKAGAYKPSDAAFKREVDRQQMNSLYRSMP
jgi:hypothetical protein